MALQIGANTWGTPSSSMGLNSGLDIAGMINKLMAAEDGQARIPLQQKLQVNQWKQDAYRSINTALSAFQGQIFNLQWSTGWQAQTATSTDTTKATAVANAGAPLGSHSLSIGSLATAATSASTTGITSAAAQNLTGTSLGATTNLTSANNSFNLTLNGVQNTITIAAGSYSASALQSAMQSAVDQAFGATQITVGLNGSSQLSLTPAGASGAKPQLKINNTSTSTGATALGFTDGQAYKFDPTATLGTQLSKLGLASLSAGSFKINNQTISFDPNVDTLNSLISKINSSAANVTASYDSISDKLMVTTKTTGSGASITWNPTGDGGLLNALQIKTNQVATGTDASVTIDGVATTQSSNKFTYGGVTYTLVGTGNATVNVATDTTAITKQITDFVNNYNTMINKIATKLYEPETYRSYPPLSISQMNTMTDIQITQYTTQAQTGLLHSDDILRQTYTSFRSTMYSSAAGTSTYHSLYDIGITTQAYNVNDQANAGKLVIDPNKLQAALSANPNDVAAIMQNVTQQLTTTSQNTVNSIIQRTGTTGSAYDSQSTTLGSAARSLEDQISNAQSKLTRQFNYYVQMFTAMDNAIGKSNQQMTYLANLKF